MTFIDQSSMGEALQSEHNYSVFIILELLGTEICRFCNR
jgi:hypothetical protein